MMYVVTSRVPRLSTRKTLLPTIITIAALSGIVGCSDDDPVRPKINPPSGPPYVTPASPQSVLANMSVAYTYRDSVGYKAVFDDNYQGTSYDPNVPGSSVNFNKSDETDHIVALVHSATITSVLLQFPPVMTRLTDLSDPPGWATIQVVNTRVEINDYPTPYTNIANSTMEFKFIPTTPAASSPTDTTWKVIRWTEFP